MARTHAIRCRSSSTYAATLALLVAASIAAPVSLAQTWINPGTGDWFTAGNWSPATVPGPGGSVIVSNGGTAQLAGVASTPLLNSFIVGLASSGTGTGTVQSNGVAILTNSAFAVGVAQGNAAPFVANGSLVITGAGAQGTGANVGTIFSTTAAGTATGTMSVDGALQMANGFLVVGQTLDAARGSVANGSLTLGGNAGSATFMNVGTAFPSEAAQVGTQATGALSIGGNLAMNGGAVGIGVTFSTPTAGFFDQAHGTTTIGGSLTLAAPTSMAIGFSNGGVAHGELQVETLIMTTGRADFSGIGVAIGGGNAFGRLASTTGDLRVGGGFGVGTAVGGGTTGTSADGALAIGGQLLCVVGGCTGLGVGTSTGTGVVTSLGSVTANGLAGFGSYNVGLLQGTDIAAGSSATGSLLSTGTGSTGNVGGVVVGSVLFTGAPGTATGTMSVGGSLPMLNGNIAVGETLGAARGSVANGSLTIAGDAGTTVFTTVGSTIPTTEAEVGTQATGALAIGGNLRVIGGGMTIGSAFGVPVGAFVDRAHGTTTIGGTLAFDVAAFLSVGISNGGIAHGELQVATIDTTAATVSVFGVGNATNGGTAFGRVTAASGDLRSGNGFGIGSATSVSGREASADGALSLGGSLSCVGNCGLSIGTASGPALANAVGQVTATGISGFSNLAVGVLSNASAAGSSADGTLIAGAGGLSNTTLSGVLNVGSAFTAAAGTSATGVVRVNGGNVSFQSIGIALALEGAGSVTGTLELTGGTLESAVFLSLGTLFNGNAPTAVADGTLRITNGQFLMSSSPLTSFASIGVTTGGGDATGRLIATDSTVSLGITSVGINTAAEGSATGIVELAASTLTAESISAGTGAGGTASILLTASTMTVNTGFSLTNGLLGLDNSFASIGTFLSLGNGATLAIDIDGLDRGIDYGAIDAVFAFLDGLLTLSFENLLPVGDSMAFDLIVSGSATGILGDFDAVNFTGVPVGYSLTAGTVLDGVEIYRVRLVRNDIPEPATALLLSMALALMLIGRRRMAARR